MCLFDNRGYEVPNTCIFTQTIDLWGLIKKLNNKSMNIFPEIYVYKLLYN